MAHSDTMRRWYWRHGQLERVAEIDRQRAEFGMLSERTYNVLGRARLQTGGQVRQMTDVELLDLRNLGVTTLAEIRTVFPYTPVVRYADGAW